MLLAAACAGAPPGRDMTRDAKLYSFTGYRASRPGLLAVHIAPVRDAREPLPALVDRVHRPAYIQDHHWARPVTVMVHDLLVEEVERSRIFRRVVSAERDADVVLRPVLLAFYGAVEETVVGRRTRGQARLELSVHGAVEPSGERPLLWTKTYEGGELTREGLGFTADPFAFAGHSLRISMARLLSDLDAGEVGQRAVAAEAAGTRRGTEPDK